jgi:hypothetical protein
LVEVTGYTAIVERSSPGWSIYVPQVDRHTWAAHLREIENMARDLVQVMTDEPIESIEVSVELPAGLRNPISDMISARASADVAETGCEDCVTDEWDADARLRHLQILGARLDNPCLMLDPTTPDTT